MHQIKVMLNSSTKRSIFVKKCETKSQVNLIRLGSPSKGNKKIYFYNSNIVSETEDTTVAFRYEKPLLNKITDIFTSPNSNHLKQGQL